MLNEMYHVNQVQTVAIATTLVATVVGSVDAMRATSTIASSVPMIASQCDARISDGLVLGSKRTRATCAPKARPTRLGVRMALSRILSGLFASGDGGARTADDRGGQRAWDSARAIVDDMPGTLEGIEAHECGEGVRLVEHVHCGAETIVYTTHVHHERDCVHLRAWRAFEPVPLHRSATELLAWSAFTVRVARYCTVSETDWRIIREHLLAL